MATQEKEVIALKEQQNVASGKLQQQNKKRRHRRGRHRQPYWKPSSNNYKPIVSNTPQNRGERIKLMRSQSLVPYNTNKFLMEEHLSEVPVEFLTPSSRTRDSSFSVDSEENYAAEDEEEFLSKEFSNVYERARMERLDSLSKTELIQECMQAEDKCATEQAAFQHYKLSMQRMSHEYLHRIKWLEEKVRDLSKENQYLRATIMRSGTITAGTAASPPSAAGPTAASEPVVILDSSSEDTESDSSASTSASSTSHASRSSSSNSSVAYVEVPPPEVAEAVVVEPSEVVEAVVAEPSVVAEAVVADPSGDSPKELPSQSATPPELPKSQDEEMEVELAVSENQSEELTVNKSIEEVDVAIEDEKTQPISDSPPP